MLVIIGPQWATLTDAEGSKRLFDPNDHTRIEIETGLNHAESLVVPVLVMNAVMPAPAELPESLKKLIYRNAIKVRNDPDFENDIQRLILGIQQLQNSRADTLSDESCEGLLTTPSQAKAAKHYEAKPAKETLMAGKPDQKKFLSRPIVFGVVDLLTIAVLASILLVRNKPLLPSGGMVRVPADSYLIGAATPVPVQLNEFWLDRYQITNEEYKKYLDATKSPPPVYWQNGEIPGGLRNHPVRQIGWD